MGFAGKREWSIAAPGRVQARRRRRPIETAFFCAFAALAAPGAMAAPEQAEDSRDIRPGDPRFNTPAFEDYQAVYTSSSSKTGGFTLQARKTGDGEKLTLIDIIPMENDVIVAQRVIDLKTHRAIFGAGPYFAWGKEYVVSRSDGDRYAWARTPVEGGDPKMMDGEISNGGYISEMFSPTIASLMPMEVGSKFRVPEAVPWADETVSSEFDEYEILRKERLKLKSGLKCECWVIEKRSRGGMTDRIWVSREAPFVFRRIRDIGGEREFTSDLLSYTSLKQ